MSTHDVVTFPAAEKTNLSSFELRVLEVMNQSRATQEKEAKFHATNALAVYQREDDRLTYRSIAFAEAKMLGKLMLRLDRKRFLPVRKPVWLIRERDWSETTFRGHKKHTITTPLMLSHDTVHASDYDQSDFSANLTSGWKFSTVTQGNDLRHVLAYTTPNPADTPPREPIKLAADFIVADPGSGVEEIVESISYNLHRHTVRASPEIEANDSENERFMIQIGVLRAARQALGDTLPDIRVPESVIE